MALNFSPEDQAWLEALFRRLLTEGGGPAPPVQSNEPTFVAQDESSLFFQTELSQKLKPGAWFCTNLQLKPNARGRAQMAEAQVQRIRLNVGCDRSGTLQAAAMRGFPVANTPEETARLQRAAGSPFVFDVKTEDVDGTEQYVLNQDQHMAETLGVVVHRGPALVWAVRAVTWDDFNEWLART